MWSKIAASLALAGSTPAALAANEGLSFMVVGDWGGIPYWPYYTPGENGVAKALGHQAGAVGAKFTLSLGDNFYFDGVKDVADHRFKDTFENVFESKHLQLPHQFHVVAGNHDHRGNLSAQLEYHEKSPRWSFPSLYYDFIETVPGKTKNMTVHFLMLDAPTLSALPVQLDHDTTPVADDYEPSLEARSKAEEQWNWVNKTLSGSTADFIVVSSHFPVWSICEHGPTKVFVEKLKPMLEAAKVSVSLAGHDHCAEHIDEGKGVQYHGIGAGDSCNWSTKHKDAVPANSLKYHYATGAGGILHGAFGQITVSEDKGLVVSHMESTGKVLYTAPAVPPRTAVTEATVV